MILNKITKNKQFVIIATILVAAFYLQPAGIQLKFCFGEDGHFDFSADAEWTNQGIPVEKHIESSPNHHHGDCLDLVLTSNDMVSCRFNSGLLLTNQTIKSLHALPVLFVSNVFTEKSNNKFYSSGILSQRCNYIPAFLSSTILLI